MRHFTRALTMAALAMSVAGAAHPTDDALESACEYGVTLALLGNSARAESAFVWLLGQSPADPRALNNLGNLELLRGDPEVALSYYRQAASADSGDAGILLNQATASMLLGDEEGARRQAGSGVRMAGGAHAAGFLLGLQYGEEEDGAPRGAPKTYVSKDELMELIRTAAGQVPRDSSQAVNPPDSKAKSAPKKPARPPVWRSAGARAGDQAAAALVYWKR